MKNYPPTISPEQLRAARGLLDWTRQELAEASGISAETVKNIEHDTFGSKPEIIDKIMRAFLKNGVEFIRLQNPSKGTTHIGVMLTRIKAD